MPRLSEKKKSGSLPPPGWPTFWAYWPLQLPIKRVTHRKTIAGSAGCCGRWTPKGPKHLLIHIPTSENPLFFKRGIYKIYNTRSLSLLFSTPLSRRKDAVNSLTRSDETIRRSVSYSFPLYFFWAAYSCSSNRVQPSRGRMTSTYLDIFLVLFRQLTSFYISLSITISVYIDWDIYFFRFRFPLRFLVKSSRSRDLSARFWLEEKILYICSRPYRPIDDERGRLEV